MNLKTARAGSYFVALVAASLSYVHQRELYDRNGLGPFAYVLPLAVDVLAIMAASVRATDEIPAGLKKAATWTLAITGTGSIAANVAVANNWVQVAAGVGAVVLYLVAELFSSALAKATAKHPAAEPATVATPPAPVAAPVATVQTPRPAAVAKPARPKVASLATAQASAGQAAKAVMAILTEQPHLAMAKHDGHVASLTGASERTVRRVRAQLAAA